MQGLASLLESTGLPKTIERMSYGEPLTNIGRANVPLLKPETAEAMMTVAPMAGPAARGAGRLVGSQINRAMLGEGGLLAPITPQPMFAVNPNVFKLSKEEFLGKPKITKNSNASDLKPIELNTLKDVEAKPFMGGKYEIKMNEDGAVVLDKGKPIASYNFGDTLVVDKPYRKSGIAKELVYEWRTEYPSPAVATERTKASQAIQEDVWKRIQQEKEATPSFQYPQEEALRLAQQRAALPVDQGGLGLLAENTPEMRARAMGFLNDVYHGTNADIQAMNVAGKGKTSGAGAFVSDNPLVTETYVSASGEGNIIPLLAKKEGLLSVNAKGRNWADIDTNTLAAKAGKKRYSLSDMELDKNSATSTDELGIIAKDLLGLKGVDIKNVKDLGPSSHIFRAKEYLKEKYGITPDETWSNVTGDQFAEARDYMDKFYKSQKSTVTSFQNPDLLRSRFAAFDPFRKDVATATAMGVALPDLLASPVDQQRQQPSIQDLIDYGLLSP